MNRKKTLQSKQCCSIINTLYRKMQIFIIDSYKSFTMFVLQQDYVNLYCISQQNNCDVATQFAFMRYNVNFY